MLENISSGYGKKEVIKNISFAIDQAQIVTLIGSNGAGKSTILKTIYALNPIWNGGEIYFGDNNISSLKPENLLRRGIVYIGQKENTFESLSIVENLKTAGYIYPYDMKNSKYRLIHGDWKMQGETVTLS
jgi:ABC-type branched-subunit amino acid transport system ATPase component